MPLFECVPNISEGRRAEVVYRIADAARERGAAVLHIDMNADAHRSVITLAGPLPQIEASAYHLIKASQALIDMRSQKGEHPRVGATDVCPIVPLRGASMQDAVAASLRLSRRVWEELGIPVYLYEQSSSRPHLTSLPDVRRGEYEGLAAKQSHPDTAPDFGTSAVNDRSGATIIGARPLLVALNIHLGTEDEAVAKDIARSIRASSAQSANAPIYPGLRAIGWRMPGYGNVQVSMNITQPERVGVHTVFKAVSDRANERGVQVEGAELIGLIPRELMRRAGEHFYLQTKPGRPLPKGGELISLAWHTLNFKGASTFLPEERILEEVVSRLCPTEWNEAAQSSDGDLWP